MRSIVLWGGLLGALASAAPAAAQTAPAAPKTTEMVVRSTKVQVYSGPGPGFYATGELSVNSRVEVIGPSPKNAAFLEIKPPRGSFGWVNALYVKVRKLPDGTLTGVVEHTDDNTSSVPVLAGSEVVELKPNVEVAKLARGTQVVIVGQAKTADDGVWLPIEATPQEVRYIPSDAVRGLTQGEAPTPRPSPAPAASGVVQTGGMQSLRLQADQAYQARDYARAKQLYDDLAKQSREQGEQIYAYNQLARIVSESRTAAARPGLPAGQGGAQATALYSTQPGGGATWSGWGVLRKTTFFKDGQPLYVLENRQGGQGPLYATTAANFTLKDYVGGWICLYGAINQVNDSMIQTQCMTVSHVALPPPGAGRR